NAAMARAALAIPAVWIPVIGVVSWVAFGHIGMIGGHLDNVLNAAFVTSGFAAALAFAAVGKGAVAAALLFMASALAEWPFFPLAAAGALLAGRSSVPPGHRPARRLFLSFMAAWLLVTVGASVAQIFDLPVAGARLLNYFFAVPLLTGIFLWGLARILAARYGTLGVTLGAVIAAAAIVGFSFLAWQGETGRRPSISPVAVREVAAAGDYATRFAPSRPLVFLLLKG